MVRRFLPFAAGTLAALACASPAGGDELVRVSTPTDERKADLQQVGVELTEHGGPGFVDVYLQDAGDRAALRDAGFVYKTVNAAPPPPADFNLLPSGRTTYRTLANINTELTSLATSNQDIVRPFTLARPTGEGRTLRGLEITTNPGARDGKPVFLLVGMHHAREWPAADIQMEWARQLIADYRASSVRARELMGKVRTLIVPVTNADGYDDSRTVGNAHSAGDPGFDSSSPEYRRKNCRLSNGTHNCGADPTIGVDPNRNYASFFGGTGSSTVLTTETYRGTGPFSEPETADIRDLISANQVVAMITTHTFGRTVLRQPGVASEPLTPDEVMYKQLGDSLGTANGYTSQLSKQLYDHGGTTDSWHYYVTGGLGFVFEMNASAFHPPHAEFVAEYDGTISGAHGGNREALYRMTEFAANPTGHARLIGSGPAGAVLRIARDTVSETQEGPDVPEHLESTMVVPSSGTFEWHVNQSSSPFAVKAGRTETWTLTCEVPEGHVLGTQNVLVARGQAVSVTPCPEVQQQPPGGEQPPGGGEAGPGGSPSPLPDVLEQPGVRTKLAATFNGRTYSIRVKGSLLGTDDGDGRSAATGGSRCAGQISLTVNAGSRRIASGRAHLDGGCGFERSFKVKASKLPRPLRRHRPRTLKAVATWGGNAYLLGARDDASARVKTRKR